MNAIGLSIPDTALLAGAVLVALALDLLFGEPPARLHPVVAMGRYLGAVGRRVSRAAAAVPRPGAEFWLGALGWCVGAALVVALAWVAGWAMQDLHSLSQAALLGALLKPMLSWRMLRDEVRAVEAALAESLDGGRQRVGWLVSRDVTALSETQVREAAVATLAENLNDSVVAPVFWFAVAGLPGATLYRFANTADAMWGYRGLRGGRYWEWAGKWAARADDVLSWVPARITALLLVLAGGGQSLARLRQEARRTPSPNSGWPMAAMAIALGVRLGKPGVYVLNPDGEAPGVQHTQRALRLASGVVLAEMFVAVILCMSI